MTTVEKISWFEILQDKFGAIYFDEAQILQFLNRACYEYVKQLFPDNEGGLVNLEVDWNILQNVQKLIYTLPADQMSADGIISLSAIATELQTLSGDAGADIFKILSIEMQNGGVRRPVKVMRHNDKAAFDINYFKKPTYSSPRYLLENNGLQFRPTDSVSNIYITALKTPITLTTEVNTDISVSAHNEIVAYAIQFAGIASRDDVMMTLNTTQMPR